MKRAASSDCLTEKSCTDPDDVNHVTFTVADTLACHTYLSNDAMPDIASERRRKKKRNRECLSSDAVVIEPAEVELTSYEPTHIEESLLVESTSKKLKRHSEMIISKNEDTIKEKKRRKKNRGVDNEELISITKKKRKEKQQRVEGVANVLEVID